MKVIPAAAGAKARDRTRAEERRAAERPVPMIDPDALRVLELPAWNEHVARRARLAAGRSAARAAVPAGDLAEARRLLAETAAARALRAAGRQPVLREEEDGLPLLRHAREQGTPLLAHELATVFRFLRQARDLRRVLADLEPYPALQELGRAMPEVADLVLDLEATVDARGVLLDSATPKLRTLRLEIAELKEQVRRAVERVAQRPDLRVLLRSSHPSIRDGRLVLAVRAAARGQVRGIYHDRSATGETVYIEPEGVVDDQNRLRDLGIDEHREVTRILWAFTRRLLDREDELRSLCDLVGRFDVACARAAIADELGLTEPLLAAGLPLEVSDVRHPLLLAMAADRVSDEPAGGRAGAAHAAVVPFSLRLGAGFDLIVLTGPNTGGKTVTLKALGLLALLARTGCFVPAAAGARVPFFPGVYADVGDEQDLTQSLSTFSGHLRRISRILEQAPRGSLVLLDELGSGTDPLEGEALSAALLDHLLKERHVGLVTTHLGRLKEFAGRRERTVNASMEFDPNSLRPTFRLVLGIPGASNALRIARHLGLPEEVLIAAERLLVESGGTTSTLFDELDRARATVERMREETAVDRRVAAETRARVSAAEERLDRDRASLWTQAEAAAEERLRRLLQEIEEPRRALLALGGRSAAAAGQFLEAIRRALAASPLAERRRAFAHALQKGDRVHLPRYNEICRVRRVLRKEEKVEVDYRSLSVTVGFDEIGPVEHSHLSSPPEPG